MKFFLTENKLESVIFKYFDNVFDGWFVQEDHEWYGISTRGYEYLLAYKKDEPKTLYYWGDGVGIEGCSNLFSLSFKEAKQCFEKYIRQKFGFDFERLV